MNQLPSKDLNPRKGEMLIYKTQDGQIRIEARMQDGTIWLTVNQMAQLFDIDKSGISRHLKNIYETGELVREATVAKFATVQKEGQRQVSRDLEYYNLDAIISVGYRVKSIIATRFRIWATERLKEYIIKGFVMDDERLKNPPVKDSFVPDYFDEMLERVRDIRASERRMYLRVRDIFAMAADYEPGWKETTLFFSKIQNKLHFAVTGKTAAELIQARADHLVPNMGLTSWKGDVVRKTDVVTAKNYLKEGEIDGLNRIVVMWLDFAEDQAKRRKQVFLKDWEKKLDDFLRFNDRDVLTHSGAVSRKAALEYAKEEYERFEAMRREQQEALGEEEYVRELERIAKRLPAPGKESLKKQKKDRS